MSDFDQFDDDLAAALQSRAGSGVGSTGAAHEAVLARAGYIRRRRAALAGGGAMSALLIGGLFLFPRDQPGSLAPSDTGEVAPSVETSGEPTTIDDPRTSTIDTVPPVVDLSVPDPASDSTQVVPDSTDAGPDGSRPASSPATGGSTAPTTATDPSIDDTTTTVDESTTTVETSSSVSTTDAPLPEPFTRTYESAGGSITVDWDGSALSLLSVSPTAGFEAEIKDDTSTRIRVEFDDGGSDTRIEVRLTGNGIDVTIS
jgi:hypothetical protein